MNVNQPYSSKKSENVIRLHLELEGEYLSSEDKIMLKRYGESSTGYSISRDILIPADMPLHNLHYAIQKLFGWQNSHLRSFELPESVFDAVTGKTVRGWASQIGVLFQPPSESEEDLFWDDDYKRGSPAVWLRKKYTGPYLFRGTLENYNAAQADINAILDHFPMVKVKESFQQFQERTRDSKDKDQKAGTIKIAPLIDLTLEEMNSSIILDGGIWSLLERLEVNSVLAEQSEILDPEHLFPVCHELYYHYDFGDDWVIKITKYKDCKDLIGKDLLSKEELADATDKVISEYKPVCLCRDGLNLVDDVGGLSGFADLLRIIYEGEDKEEQNNMKIWAKSLGWSDKKTSIKQIF